MWKLKNTRKWNFRMAAAARTPPKLAWATPREGRVARFFAKFCSFKDDISIFKDDISIFLPPQKRPKTTNINPKKDPKKQNLLKKNQTIKAVKKPNFGLEKNNLATLREGSTLSTSLTMSGCLSRNLWKENKMKCFSDKDNIFFCIKRMISCVKKTCKLCANFSGFSEKPKEGYSQQMTDFYKSVSHRKFYAPIQQLITDNP